MVELGEIVEKVRSKNAGPFWLTIDVFCGSQERFAHILKHLDDAVIAKALATSVSDIKRFDVVDLNVIKISIPRPSVQGT